MMSRHEGRIAAGFLRHAYPTSMVRLTSAETGFVVKVMGGPEVRTYTTVDSAKEAFWTYRHAEEAAIIAGRAHEWNPYEALPNPGEA